MISNVNGVNLVHFFERSSSLGKWPIDVEYLEILREAGFDQIVFPVESGSPRILKVHATNKVLLDKMDLIKLMGAMTALGIKAPVNMMIGFPDETEGEIQQTIDFARRLKDAGAPYVTFFIPIPFPGSRLHDMAIENGHLDRDFDPDIMNWKRPVMKNTAVPPEKIEEVRDWANEKVNTDAHIRLRLEQSVGYRWRSGQERLKQLTSSNIKTTGADKECQMNTLHKVPSERHPRACFLVGGAGFIGSHFTDALLAMPECRRVTIYDNFSAGREWHYLHHARDPRLTVIRAGIEDYRLLRDAMEGHNLVIHLASNPDIARAAREPAIDFDQGTRLTQLVLEAMRESGVRRILYASGSGVYGDLGELEASEDYGPKLPVSTYGASQLAGESLINAYCSMFDFTGCAFRFANVVGPRQTHGVGFDFLRRLLLDRARLSILGDGSQSKSYIHINDVVAAVLLANLRSPQPYEVYNVATGDYITVKEIAELSLECAGLLPGSVKFEFGKGNRGWNGDVPVVRLNSDRIRGLGWTSSMGSREALRSSMLEMLDDGQLRMVWAAAAG
jgi:UDP-glucose 4-epimerase